MARTPAGKRKPKPSSARGSTGITNHPLDEELRRQRQLPPRGYRKRGKPNRRASR